MPRVPADRRREQLVAATIDLAIEEGLPAASVRRIAERANVSLGVVHYCFSSKEALINAVAESFLNPIIGPVAEALRDVADEPMEVKARAAVQTFWDTTIADPGRQLLSYELASWSIRGDGEAARLLYKTYLDVIEDFLGDGLGIEGTEEMSTRTLARMALTLTDGAMLAWLVDRDDAATAEVVQSYLAMLLSFIDQAVKSGKMTVRGAPPAQEHAAV
ncbi:TetR/AcrR family transcriptional regulator [Mobilicoccus pelagius]|uniref:Putative TetR family transcriptional regulator n=1 Tax=Mobilicoccus pelagius NBRC 104925 TaxID=1089455 RepID=H5UQB7_9MICO|nr:TetR/AcrR family transcriptional regulator [Mobilicoccus pelagius]GAB47925.1 putative TetR family transcriptional regulator [Mobilicoccus pelagius NBRC 104925]